nr:Phage virion morphogenesis protein [uncultured Mediterranean phage uvMED]
MVADIEVKVNTIEVKNFLTSLRQKQKSAINSALSRVSNMAVLMITKRTQSGKLPDGGNMLPYAKSTKKTRRKKGRQISFVDLTDSGKMFRSLDFRTGGFKSTLFFANKEREKIASFHDSFGVGKKKVKRPFFAIGRKEEEQIKEEFSKFYFNKLGI